MYCNTYVTDYDGTNVTTNSDLELQSETLIWAAGVTGNPVKGIKNESLVDRANRYKVNRYNQVEWHDYLLALFLELKNESH